MKKTSIVIPIYNAEKFLDKCLKSIRDQSHTNIEVILVDDGSKDGSAGICKDFCEKDSRFKYIHKENSGVSSARNLGLENVTGEYIAFVDADDFIEDNYVSKMVETMESDGSDIAMCRIDTSSLDKGLNAEQISYYKKFYEGKVSAFDAIKVIFEYPAYGTMITNKLFKRDVIWNNDSFVRFPEDFRCGEDQLWLLSVIKNAKQTSFIKDELYHWTVNVNSVFRSRNNPEIFIEDIKCQIQSIDVMSECHDDELLQSMKDRLIDKIYTYRVITYVTGTESQKDKLNQFYKENKNIKHSPVRFRTAFKRQLIHIGMDLGISKQLIRKLSGVR